jgi:hypothetical protein
VRGRRLHDASLKIGTGEAGEEPGPGGDHMYIPIGIGTLIVIIVLIALLA